ncbi:hypothetical protein NQ314_008088 [Rhamnusium bicolor]|uniref:Double jelly roll-like domain-containing protein n=1 Tax=Rhamnusium bicolor TaxID=1586634 RepID=A0AAV8YGB6_9CUCU|nr:hypothetical protein NQ314_008088 [Rhamnusium bicolor]
MDLLSVTEQLYVDNTIVISEIHSYEPYLPTKLSYNDEIVIPIQEVDKFTLPCESFLYIEGKLTKSDGTISDGTISDKLKFINNGVPFLFKEIRYLLNRITVDSVRDVGLTSTLKSYLSYKLSWNISHISVGIPQELALTKLIDNNSDIILGFRSWELVEFPELPETSRHNWPVKTTTKLETPRHVIIAFQTSRRNNVSKDMSKFDNCNLRNIKVFLNSERYPYNDLYLNFKENKFASLYDMFAKFRQSYYELQNESIFTPIEFRNVAPITYIDCSRQKESIQSSPIVMRVEFECSDNILKNTSAYCLILHDKLISYNPLTKIVRQL